jgi:hypothetical protein
VDLTETSTRSANNAANPAVSRSLYLNLLKRSLTNTLFDLEPDIDDDEFRFVRDRADHYVKGAAISMLPLGRAKVQQGTGQEKACGNLAFE